MFVKNRIDGELRYYKSQGCIVLKPNSITLVDDSIVTAKELKDCYGDRIAIISGIQEVPKVKGAPVIEKDKPQVVLVEREEKLTNESLLNILNEIEKEGNNKESSINNSAPIPTEQPTEAPTPAPIPTEQPTEAPTPIPTEQPTEAPTPAPKTASKKATPLKKGTAKRGGKGSKNKNSK